MSPHSNTKWCLGLCLIACQLLSALSVNFSPCDEIKPIRRSDPFPVGLAFWPGGLEQFWNFTGSLCDAEVQANLTGYGVMFGTYRVRADRLTVLKTSFPEELMLTSRAPAGLPKVMSVVAFRKDIRSDVRYIASFDPEITGGFGFVSSLALLAKFELGTLRYLQFYNLTCNDCGGRTSDRCINSTSCALAPSSCTCSSTGSSSNSNSSNSNSSSSFSPSPSPSPKPSPEPSQRRLLEDATGNALLSNDTLGNSTAGNDTATDNSTTNGTLVQLGAGENTGGASTCNYGNFSFCATGINLAFEGVDMNSAPFTTASQVKKLSSYSLVSLYFQAKAAFLDVQDMFTAKAGEYWGNFGAVQQNIQDAYSGNAEAATDAASSGVVG